MNYHLVPMDRSHLSGVADLEKLCFTTPWNEAMLEDELFSRGYERLKENTMELIAFENTFVEGIINCDRPGLLYTSIPQNGNWSVRVDGREAEITLIGDVMVGVALTEGSHTVSFTYRNGAFSLGWKISLLCTASFLALAYGIYRPQLPMITRRRPKGGRFQR